MRLHRFYIDPKYGSLATLQKDFIFPSELLHQWKRVFRFVSGDKVILFDGSGFEYECEIVSLNNKHGVTELKVLKTRDKQQKAAKEVWLFATLIKKDNFEWIVQKATELGVSHIVPVVSERSEKKGLNLERAQKIVIEASEQSGRVTLPTIEEPKGLADVIQGVTQGMKCYAFDPTGETFMADGQSGVKSTNKAIGIFIGPEGGWSEKELEAFRSASISIYSIGSQILRAETAAVAVTSLLLLG